LLQIVGDLSGLFSAASLKTRGCVDGFTTALKSIMPQPTVRERILQALEDLPSDATFEDAIERLVLLAKIDAGLAELDAGKGVLHEEAKRRLGM
jgi:hypothetical protein